MIKSRSDKSMLKAIERGLRVERDGSIVSYIINRKTYKEV